MLDSLLFAVVILAGVIAIAVLCYVWMKNSRASQTRMESYDRQIVTLLEKQNEILLTMSERLNQSGQGR
ncbi:MAG: hypothetical protein ABI718_11430 [Acidobacteriota bacterium]